MNSSFAADGNAERPALVTSAFEHYRSGRLDEADRICRRILAATRDHFDAQHLLGAIQAQRGRWQDAFDCFRKAVAIDPSHHEAQRNRQQALEQLARQWIDQGLRHQRENRPDEAAACYGRVLAHDDVNLTALILLGACEDQRGHHELALSCLDKAISIKPDLAAAHYLRAVALSSLKRLPDALASLDRAVAVKPDYAEAYLSKGCLLQDAKRFADAVACFDKAIAVKPDFADAYWNRGIGLSSLGQSDRALAEFDKAIALNPNSAEAHFNRGRLFDEELQFGNALADYDRAIAIKPDYFDAHANRGLVLGNLRRFDEGLRSYDQAIEMQPDNAIPHFNEGMTRLLLGDFEKGWRKYEWRWAKNRQGGNPARFSRQLWLGDADISGKTILLWSEQGLGDTIQFCRYAKLVAALGARVILEVQRPLLKVLAGLEGVSRLVEAGQPLPGFDYQCPLLSLPLAFKTSLESVPAQIPYLGADPKKVAEWEAVFRDRRRPRVGLVWNGGFRPDQPELWATNERRNIPFEKMRILNMPEITFYSLQKGEPAESELRARRQELRPEGNLLDYSDGIADFADTAALIAGLDLVISVDTSVAHLAGALGKPVWILSRYNGCWRWLLNRDDSPWYPGARIYRQESLGDWDGVLARVRADLKRFRPPR